MRTHPKLDVVISSHYRELIPLDVMRTFFSRDIQHRIVGATPVLPRCRRVDEIRAHVKATSYRGSFIVLDDAADEFPRNYRPLILCQTRCGLGERELDELRNRLAQKNRSSGITSEAGESPGFDADAQDVWNRWQRLNCIVSGRDVPDEVLAIGQPREPRETARPRYKLADLMTEMEDGLPRVDGWDEMPSVGREC